MLAKLCVFIYQSLCCHFSSTIPYLDPINTKDALSAPLPTISRISLEQDDFLGHFDVTSGGLYKVLTLFIQTTGAVWNPKGEETSPPTLSAHVYQIYLQLQIYVREEV
jgi:hypothetical protein